MNSSSYELKDFSQVESLHLAGPETRHDYAAQSMINHAAHLVSEAKTINDLRRAEIVFHNAGILAAREALSYGIEIRGWRGTLDRIRLPEIGEGDPPESFVSEKLSQLDALPDRYQILANLADSNELRVIRQTGGPLITADREVRFAMARVEEARRVLDLEEAELANEIVRMQAALGK